jgi:hypothetical protein
VVAAAALTAQIYAAARPRQLRPRHDGTWSGARVPCWTCSAADACRQTRQPEAKARPSLTRTRARARLHGVLQPSWTGGHWALRAHAQAAAAGLSAAHAPSRPPRSQGALRRFAARRLPACLHRRLPPSQPLAWRVRCGPRVCLRGSAALSPLRPRRLRPPCPLWPPRPRCSCAWTSGCMRCAPRRCCGCGSALRSRPLELRLHTLRQGSSVGAMAASKVSDTRRPADLQSTTVEDIA